MIFIVYHDFLTWKSVKNEVSVCADFVEAVAGLI